MPRPMALNRMRLRLADLTEVQRWILSWGKHAQAVSPPSLRKQLAETVPEMGRLYPPQ